MSKARPIEEPESSTVCGSHSARGFSLQLGCVNEPRNVRGSTLNVYGKHASARLRRSAESRLSRPSSSEATRIPADQRQRFCYTGVASMAVALLPPVHALLPAILTWFNDLFLESSTEAKPVTCSKVPNPLRFSYRIACPVAFSPLLIVLFRSDEPTCGGRFVPG